MKEKKKYQLVKIVWEDAVANPNWFNYSEMQEWANKCACKVEEVGFLVFHTKDYAILSSSVANETPLTEEKLGQIHLIPNRMIISFEKLQHD